MVDVPRNLSYKEESGGTEDVHYTVAHQMVEGGLKAFRMGSSKALLPPLGELGLSFTVFIGLPLSEKIFHFQNSLSCILSPYSLNYFSTI